MTNLTEALYNSTKLEGRCVVELLANLGIEDWRAVRTILIDGLSVTIVRGLRDEINKGHFLSDPQDPDEQAMYTESFLINWSSC